MIQNSPNFFKIFLEYRGIAKIVTRFGQIEGYFLKISLLISCSTLFIDIPRKEFRNPLICNKKSHKHTNIRSVCR
jgi:hypothetical protein